MNERLYQALLTVFGDSERFTAADVLKRSRYVAAPKFSELRAALEAVLGAKFGAIKVGRWLSAHRDTEAADLRLIGDYDSHSKRWNYTVFKMAPVAELKRENAATVKRIREQREARLIGKGLEGRLKQIEKDNTALNALKEASRAARSDRLYKERQAAANIEAQQAIDTAEKQRPKRSVFLAPTIGHFVFEDKTEKRCSDLVELGYAATVGYLSATRFVIWIDNEPDMKELKRVALRFLLTVHEAEKPTAAAKTTGLDQIWHADRQRYRPAPTAANPLGYDVDARYLNRTADPRQRTGPTIRTNPFMHFDWRIF